MTRGSARRSLASLQAAIGATTLALVLGSLVAFAVHRFRFFGREGLSFLVLLPIALPGIVTGHRAEHDVPDIRHRLRPADSHHRPRHVLRRGRLQQRRRPAAPHGPSAQEASMDLGADTWQTFRRITLPAIGTSLVAGALLAFALSFDEIIVDDVHGRRGHPDAADLDLLELLAAEPAAAGERRVRPGPGAVDHPGLHRRADHVRPGGRRGRARLGSPRRPGSAVDPLSRSTPAAAAMASDRIRTARPREMTDAWGTSVRPRSGPTSGGRPRPRSARSGDRQARQCRRSALSCDLSRRLARRPSHRRLVVRSRGIAPGRP